MGSYYECISGCTCYKSRLRTVYKAFAYNIRLLGKLVVLHAFRSKPLDWKSDHVFLVLAKIILASHVHSKTKVSHFYNTVYTHPAFHIKFISYCSIQ